MTNTTAANNSDDAEQKVDDTRPAAPLGVAVATAPVVNNQPYNPYLRRRPISIAAMGIQSQLRGGGVKACLKRGTKRKAQSYKQSAVPGGSIFTPWKHLSQLKAASEATQIHWIEAADWAYESLLSQG